MTEKENIVKILAARFVTHDVKQFIIERPKGYKFIPGQATEVSINNEKWINEKRPFTFTSLNEDKVLEFVIKRYKVGENPAHKGVTEELHKLKQGDEIIIREVWGTINYKGPGVFIAGGAGITPFIAILRDLNKKNEIEGNTLIFSNKEHKDIILEREFKEYLGENCIFTLTREKREGYLNERIDEEFLKKHIKDFKQHFYVCGPKKFKVEITEILKKLGAKAEAVVIEQ